MTDPVSTPQPEQPVTAKRWLKRFQEFTGWVPALVVLSIIGYVVLVPLARVSPEMMAWLAELPVRTAYAAAALGMTVLAWRRQRVRMTDEMQCAYWSRVLAGERGPVIVFVVNATFFVVTLAIFVLGFFGLAR